MTPFTSELGDASRDSIPTSEADIPAVRVHVASDTTTATSSLPPLPNPRLDPADLAAQEAHPIGRNFGSYKVLAPLGAGGMARVYLATHADIGGRFAVKILEGHTRNLPELLMRCLREAQTAAKIQHPNVVKVIHAGRTDDDLVYVVMDLVEGQTLEALLRQRGPLPWARLGPIALQMCRGLAAAHRNGIIHRDIKPSNCILDARVEHTDHVKIIDFGIAKPTAKNPDEVVTAEGVILGTPEYMAPEYASGELLDIRVDIYALGVTLYKLLTGKLPITGTSFAGIMYQHVNYRPEPPSFHIPYLKKSPVVDEIILKALSKRPQDRFSNMREMADAISQSLIGVPEPARHPLEAPGHVESELSYTESTTTVEHSPRA
ncbi:MAG: serine/threonine-protein kinase, partial [Nannocystaceae bacterium]